MKNRDTMTRGFKDLGLVGVTIGRVILDLIE